MNTCEAVFLALLSGLFVVGCTSTANIALDENSICEVHTVEMTVREIPGHPGGFSGYTPAFHSAMRRQFPHHGRARYSEDHGYLYARRLRTHVCDECTIAYDRWHQERAEGQDTGN